MKYIIRTYFKTCSRVIFIARSYIYGLHEFPRHGEISMIIIVKEGAR